MNCVNNGNALESKQLVVSEQDLHSNMYVELFKTYPGLGTETSESTEQCTKCEEPKFCWISLPDPHDQLFPFLLNIFSH